MCGVFGLSFSSESKSQEWWQTHLNKVNATQAHRGPDEQDLWISPDGHFGFAHQRLAILDLSPTGRQPMKSQSGKSLLVFNGEIYNHQELKTHLPGFSFRGHSDSEVLLECLEQKGDHLLKELDGMFAFAFADLDKKRMLLATDPAGKKPLYTYWDGRTFAFASEIKALKVIPEIQLKVSKKYLKQYLVYGYVPYPNTIYENVTKVPAGSYQWIDLKSRPGMVRAYWDLPLQPHTSTYGFRKSQEILDDLLTTAIKKRLGADVPVGCFLSGGLDSSVVSLIAAKIFKEQKLKTFSVSFKAPNIPAHYDESPYARYVAEKIHSDHHEIHVDVSNLNSTPIMTHFDEPFADSSAIPTYLLAQETAKHVKVALSGDGGDEIFGGYMRFRAGLLSSEYAWLLKPLLAPIHFGAVPPRSWKGFLKRFKERLHTSPLIQQISWNSYFNQNDFDKYMFECAEDIYLKAREFEFLTEDLDVGQKILYYNFKTYLFDDLLPKVDRMSMAHGLEVRSPFLDKKLIEFAFALPTSFKMDFFGTKKILKRTYAPELGKEFVYRKKQGFALPIENFIEAQNSSNAFQKIPAHLKGFSFSAKELNEMKANQHHQKIFMLLSLENNLGALE
jgi:asparagine synthase (glutamine-hydrolysing)